MKKILVIAPHADDEVLGCGGTIHKYHRNGDEVVVAIMTNAFLGAPELFSTDSIETVRSESLQAHAILGVKNTVFCDLPAPRLDHFPQYKIALEISQLISNTEPNTLYIPHRGDLHLDHAAIFNACLVAARPYPGQTVKEIFSYETLSETEWGHPTPDSAFIPTKFNVLSKNDLEMKITAMAKFRSQLKDFPNSRSLHAIRCQAELRGAAVGVEKAEAFSVIRCIT